MTAAPEPGVTLAERYLLQRTAWTSPFGPVWAALDTVLHRPVYVQSLDESAEAERRRTFRKAAARAAQFTHPALLRVDDIGDDPPFVVFEMASGGRIEDRLKQGPLDVQDAVRIALALARGLEALHERSSWHGHISPQTVFLDAEGRPKIMAGMGEVLAVAGRTRPSGYQTPETDPSPAGADRFALAALTYQMLTGRSPARPALPPRQTRRRVPHTLDRLLVRALSPDGSVRPSLDEFESAMAPFARPSPPDVREPRFTRSSEFRWLAPAVLIVGLAAAAVIIGLRVDFSEEPRPPATPTVRDRGTSITVPEARDFDPPPGNGEENANLASNAIDGRAQTEWRTVGYRTRDLGGAKTGVGLLFDLGETREVAAVRIRSTLAGWSAEWRAGDDEPSSSDDLSLVTTFTATEDTDLRLPQPRTARYFLLWITGLVDDQSGNEFPYRAFVGEVEFFPS